MSPRSADGPALQTEALAQLNAHTVGGCATCRAASGVRSMCPTGAELYVRHLRAISAMDGTDPERFPSVRAHLKGK